MMEDYFRKHPWHKSEEKPIPPPLVAQDGTVLCTICHGAKEAPTRSYFGRNGDRKSGFIGFCQTCKGRGRIAK